MNGFEMEHLLFILRNMMEIVFHLLGLADVIVLSPPKKQITKINDIRQNDLKEGDPWQTIAICHHHIELKL